MNTSELQTEFESIADEHANALQENKALEKTLNEKDKQVTKLRSKLPKKTHTLQALSDKHTTYTGSQTGQTQKHQTLTKKLHTIIHSKSKVLAEIAKIEKKGVTCLDNFIGENDRLGGLMEGRLDFRERVFRARNVCDVGVGGSILGVVREGEARDGEGSDKAPPQSVGELTQSQFQSDANNGTSLTAPIATPESTVVFPNLSSCPSSLASQLTAAANQSPTQTQTQNEDDEPTPKLSSKSPWAIRLSSSLTSMKASTKKLKISNNWKLKSYYAIYSVFNLLEKKINSSADDGGDDEMDIVNPTSPPSSQSSTTTSISSQGTDSSDPSSSQSPLVALASQRTKIQELLLGIERKSNEAQVKMLTAFANDTAMLGIGYMEEYFKLDGAGAGAGDGDGGGEEGGRESNDDDDDDDNGAVDA